MDLETILGALRRQWWASLLTLAVAAAAVIVVPRQISPEFQVSGDVILLSPATLDGGASVNPWSRFGGAETGAAAALVTVLNGASTKERLVVGDVKTVDVGINRSNGAIIGVSVLATSSEGALRGYQDVVAELDEQLRLRQAEAGAAVETWLRLDALTVPSRAEELPGSRTRAMAALAVVGVVAAICAAVVLDVTVGARLAHRSRRRAARGRVLPPPHPGDAATGLPRIETSDERSPRRAAIGDAEVHVLNGARTAHGGRRR